MSTRTTDVQVSLAIIRVDRLLKRAGVGGEMIVYRGDRTHGVTNKIIVDRRMLLPGTSGGYTKGELFDALTIMEHTLQLVVDSNDTPPPNLITLPVPHLAPAS